MARELLETDAELRKRVEKRYEARKDFLGHLAAYSLVIGGMWALYLTGSSDSLWPIYPTLAWGAGLAGHAIDTYFNVGKPARQRDQAVWREMRQLYGDDWRETATRAEYDEVRKRAKKDFDRRKDFSVHLAVFVMINLMFWLIWFSAGASGFPWPLLPGLGWGAGLAAHASEVWFNKSRESAIEREVEKERQRLAYEAEAKQKRKREERLTLTADGDVLEIVDAPDESMKDKRR